MATVAAAIIATARREVEQLFLDNEAFSSDRAIEFAPRNGVQQRYLDQLIGEGVVHEAAQGRFWFDLAAYKERQRLRLVWTVRVLAAAVVVFVVILAVRTIMHLR